MVLFRGKRHSNGRTDVLVYGQCGEMWLHVAAARRFSGGEQYGWGRDKRGLDELGHDLILVATSDLYVAELLGDELAEQWLLCLCRDDWAYADFEIRKWVISELANEIMHHRENPGKGGVPCPSEN